MMEERRTEEWWTVERRTEVQQTEERRTEERWTEERRTGSASYGIFYLLARTLAAKKQTVMNASNRILVTDAMSKECSTVGGAGLT